MREINVEALKNNFDLIKKTIHKNVCVMVKADAYGHGLRSVCMALKNDADFFGVATIYEAKKIRSFGVTNKILVVGKSELCDLVSHLENDVDISVFSFDELKQIEEFCKQKKKKMRIHIKVNSGMNRLGVKTIKEFNLMQNLLKNSKNLEFCGLFTHFCSIKEDKTYFEKQKKTFELFVSVVDKMFKPLIHVGGSGAICEEFSFHVDMVRAGLALYGYSSDLPVQKVMRVTSKILQINEVLPYEMTGYFPCKTASFPRRTATIFYGYADGIPKKLTNQAFVKINNQKSEVLGVCMDMIICDVTNVLCEEGDDVVVFDDAEVWAEKLGVIPYEVLTGFKNLRKH